MQLLTLDQIMDMWDKDSPVDKTEPGDELLKIPVLHSKYIRQLHGHSLAAKAKHSAYTALRKLKYDYYSGKLDEAELKKRGLEPFRFVLKGDINTYIEADQEVLNIRNKIAYHEEASELCRAIVKELNNRSYELRAHIDWLKFTEGAG